MGKNLIKEIPVFTWVKKIGNRDTQEWIINPQRGKFLSGDITFMSHKVFQGVYLWNNQYAIYFSLIQRTQLKIKFKLLEECHLSYSLTHIFLAMLK